MTSTTNTSITTTDACPTWCTQHESNAGHYGDTNFHHSRLAWSRPELADGQGPVAIGLTIDQATGAYNGEALHWAPGMSLGVFDSIPASVPPAEARKLAAALLEGAEIVESYLTARCAVCDCAVVPEDADGCLPCKIRARQARMPRLVRVSNEVAGR